jgi:hypothetical protein
MHGLTRGTHENVRSPVAKKKGGGAAVDIERGDAGSVERERERLR